MCRLTVMKTFNDLITIAKKYSLNNDIPENPFLLCGILQLKYVPLTNEEQYHTATPAYIDVKNKTIYFKTSGKYADFYVYHEIAHYILGHSSNSSEEQYEANLLACLLIAPPELIPSYLHSSNDLCRLARIPIDFADEYWSELRMLRYKKYKTRILLILILSVVILSVAALLLKVRAPMAPDKTVNTGNDVTYYCTQYGEKYHLKSCPTVKNSQSLRVINDDEIRSRKMKPCKICIGD